VNRIVQMSRYVESSTCRTNNTEGSTDVHRNSVDMTAQPADDWQQNADAALMQSQRLERSEQPGTEDSVA